MNSLRSSLASIPGTLANLINDCTPPPSFQSTSPTPTPTNTTDDGDESFTSISDKSLSIPASLLKDQWRLIFTSEAKVPDIENAIKNCHEQILQTEECSEERRWLVRHLIDLRYSLKELQEAEIDPMIEVIAPAVKSIVGHHFIVNQRNGLQTTAMHCDHCTGIIWSMVQVSYICLDCRYLTHQKCIDSVVRICAHVIVSERQYPIRDICPEIGLAAQQYTCRECTTLLNFQNSWIEPRICDYNGYYYCPSCHWNDSSIIPARIVHNWDFSLRKISRSALQEINLFRDKPLIKLEEANPKLFVFLTKLSKLKKLRQNLVYMRKYLTECRDAIDSKLLEQQIGSRRHLIQSTDFYSINDLEQTENGSLSEFLCKILNIFESHIRGCDMCLARAYLCEICSNNELIFPFDDGCIVCEICNSIYHRVCRTRKNTTCPKCVRLEERRLKMISKKSNHNDNDNDDNDDSSSDSL